MKPQVTIKAALFSMLVVAIWCKAAPVVYDLGKSGYSIYRDWSYNRVIHDRIEVINENAGRTTWPDRLK